MEDELYWNKLRELVREEITDALKLYGMPEPSKEDVMMGTAATCKELSLSKQILYNWQKRSKTKPLIEANRQKVGNKVLYNVTGIKAAIKQNPLLFGGGRDYKFKSAAILS